MVDNSTSQSTASDHLDADHRNSSIRPDTTDLNTLYSHRIRVPDTSTVLHLRVHTPYVRFDKDELRTFLHLVQGTIQFEVERQGGSTLYPVGANNEQDLDEDWPSPLPHIPGMHLGIRNAADIRYFTYQQVWEVLQGVRMFMLGEGRNHPTRFTFWNGPGRFPDWGIPLGFGWVDRLGLGFED